MSERLAWTIRRVEESDSNEPIAPWQGKVIDRGDGVLRVHHFHPTTGEIDEDTNAYAIVKEFDLYETKEDAIAAYIVALTRWRNWKADEIKQIEEEVNKVIGEIGDLTSRRRIFDITRQRYFLNLER